METVTVSPKFQVVIPRKVREVMGIQVGHKIQVIAYDESDRACSGEIRQRRRGAFCVD